MSLAIAPGSPAGLIDPIAEYDHDEGTAIIGGFVYHGSLIPELQGKYVFGDLTRPGSGPGGRLLYADLTTGLIQELMIGNADSPLGLFVKGFGQDANGELYVLGSTTIGPSGTAGVALALKAASNLPWQNSANCIDVNADGQIAPLDALIVINELNSRGTGPLPAPPGFPPPFYDVNGNDEPKTRPQRVHGATRHRHRGTDRGRLHRHRPRLCRQRNAQHRLHRHRRALPGLDAGPQGSARHAHHRRGRHLGRQSRGRPETGRPQGRGLQGFSRAARPQGRRRGGHRHARPLARADHDRGLRGRQGRVRGKTADAQAGGRRRRDRGPEQPPADRAGRHAAAEHAAISKGVRDRQVRPTGRHPQGPPHLEPQHPPLESWEKPRSIPSRSTGSVPGQRQGPAVRRIPLSAVALVLGFRRRHS